MSAIVSVSGVAAPGIAIVCSGALAFAGFHATALVFLAGGLVTWAYVNK